MTVADAIRTAVQEKSPEKALQVMQFLRHQRGWNNAQIERAVRECGCDAEEWRELVEETDEG